MQGGKSILNLEIVYKLSLVLFLVTSNTNKQTTTRIVYLQTPTSQTQQTIFVKMADQRILLNELANHNMLNPWAPSPGILFTGPSAQAQLDMLECCEHVPFALHLSDRNTGNRVFFKVYDDAEKLVQSVLDFAHTTNPEFFNIARDAYIHWIKNGEESLWNPEMFLERISQHTFFIWSSTPNYDMNDEAADWTPAANEWIDIHLEEILYPAPTLSISPYPEFAVLDNDAKIFAQINNIAGLTEILDPHGFLRNIRKTRFLTLGLPAVTFTSAVCEQIIPSLIRAEGMFIPDRMVTWAQDIDLFVLDRLKQNIKPADDALFGSMAIRQLGDAILDKEEHDRGVEIYLKAYNSGLL